MRDHDNGDGFRRMLSVMRFVTQMREAAGERELLESLIQAAAVWYDLDARAYRRDLRSRFTLEINLPGADVAGDPTTLDISNLVSPEAPCHVSSLSDLEQLGWRGVQGEVLLLPVTVTACVRWVVAVPGTVERDVEQVLMLVCRTAGAVIEQQKAVREREIEERLRRRMTEGRETFQSRARGLVQELAAIVSGNGVRVSVRAGVRRALTLAAVGQQWAGVPTPALEPGASAILPGMLAFGLPLGNDAVAILEVAAEPGRPFTVEQADSARGAAPLVGAWLSGVSSGAGKALAREAETQATAPPFEREIQTELDRARRLSLNGGVLVATVAGAPTPDPGVLSTVIQVVRTELRSSDLLGQLAGGDIAAVLVRTSPDGVATAAVRVRERLDALSRERRLPAVVVGHAMYPGAGLESPTTLVKRARQDAGLMFSN